MLEFLQSELNFRRFCILKKVLTAALAKANKPSSCSYLTCTTIFCAATLLFNELSPLDADDSLERRETVSLNAESLSGLSVREDSLKSVDVAVLDIVEIAPETIELERLCV